jgi:hypothetical protein
VAARIGIGRWKVGRKMREATGKQPGKVEGRMKEGTGPMKEEKEQERGRREH